MMKGMTTTYRLESQEQTSSAGLKHNGRVTTHLLEGQKQALSAGLKCTKA